MSSVPRPFKEHCLESLQSEIEMWAEVHSTSAEFGIILDPSNIFSNTLLVVICDGEDDYNLSTSKQVSEASEDGAVRTVKWNGVDNRIIGSVKDGVPELEIEDNRPLMRMFFDERGQLREDVKFMNRIRNRLKEERKARKKEKKLRQKEERQKQAPEGEDKVEILGQRPTPDLVYQNGEEGAKQKREKRKAKQKAQKTRRADEAVAEAETKAVAGAVAQLHRLRMQGVDISGARILYTSTEEATREMAEVRHRE